MDEEEGALRAAAEATVAEHKAMDATVEPPSDTVRDFIASGQALQTKFISIAETEASAGNANIEPVENEGWNITVEKGTVMGWLWLKVQNLQEKLVSQAGLLHAAGLQVQQMRVQLAQTERSESGLIVPPGTAPIAQKTQV